MQQHNKKKSTAKPSVTKPGKGSGLPREIAGEIDLDAGLAVIQSDIASAHSAGRKDMIDQRNHAETLKKLLKGHETKRSPAFGNPTRAYRDAGGDATPRSVPGTGGLTVRQTVFAHNIMAGMSRSAAYRDAYDAHNLKPSVIFDRVYRLMQNTKVKSYISQLWQRRESKLSHTPEFMRLFIQERLMHEAVKEDNNGSTRVRALELLGKVAGTDLFSDDRDKDKDKQGVSELMDKIDAIYDAGRKALEQAK